MLPFLKPKKTASLMIANTSPDGGIESLQREGEEDPGYMQAIEELMSALANKDSLAVASAFRAAYQMCDAEPYEEEASE